MLGFFFQNSYVLAGTFITTSRAIKINFPNSSSPTRIPSGSLYVADSCSGSYCTVYMRYQNKKYKIQIPKSYLNSTGTSLGESNSTPTYRYGATTPRTPSSGLSFGSFNPSSPTCNCTAGSCRVTSGFGRRTPPRAGASSNHQGMDIGGGAGTPIVASDDGYIESASYAGGYGKMIQINHGSGYKTRYAHLSRIVRGSGYVQKGELIGYMGSTGVATGPHLHFEVIKNGTPVNPANYVGTRVSTLSVSCSSLATTRTAGGGYNTTRGVL